MTTVTLRVKVFHNARDDGEERRFQTGDPLREVVAFDLPMTGRDPQNRVRRMPPQDQVWWKLVLNLRWGGPRAGWLQDFLDYQRRNNRYLRIGDVVVVGEQAWAIADLVHAPAGQQSRFSPKPKWQPVSLFGSEILTAS